jgi:hypothetical protein
MNWTPKQIFWFVAAAAAAAVIGYYVNNWLTNRAGGTGTTRGLLGNHPRPRAVVYPTRQHKHSSSIRKGGN